MSERTPNGEAGDAGPRPETQASGAQEAPGSQDVHPEEFRPDSTEGRGGRPEDLSPDDFE
ncbi:hypothetical protein HUT06_09800 [Actinomadura sp. NAK00032]|uniref:hypothetical protein n=1 Tax=Actinomadura sp. NAK00032 TaxID=2742128 RepID=UPI001591E6CD|nr:hypothetical protein [Actinomadura sp. NAK00032]QKW34285.1 hypothetical protein HUT06_09800 [Actinomadura sp. NAK00032]